MATNIRGRNYLKLLDYSSKEMRYLLDLAKNFKDMKRAGVPHKYLEGKNIVLLFEKTGVCYHLGAGADVCNGKYRLSQVGAVCSNGLPGSDRAFGCSFIYR